MKKLLISFTLFIICINAYSTRIIVGSIPELQAAVRTAKPGDIILMKDGSYKTDSNITVAVSGLKGKLITIAAEHAGKVQISGSGGFQLSGNYILIRDFIFTHASGKARSLATAAFCRWTNNIFETPGDGEDLTIAANDNEVDHNTFRNKNAMGRFLAVRGTGSQIAERLWIHHNYFHHQQNQGGKNGAETLQFGLSGFSLSSSRSIVEYNLFEDCNGENEMISVKASRVVLRYNTIRNCPAQFTLRHGNFCEVYSNYFFNTPGLRIFGDDHVIHSNYFENCDPAITIGNGGAEVADGAPLTSHDRPDRVLIAFNTLVNNKVNVTMTPRKDGLGATSIRVSSNLIYGGGPAATISGPMKDSVWDNNLIFKTAGAGDMPLTGFKNADPLLKADATGVYRLHKASAITKTALKNFKAITVDMDGQKRMVVTDIGADEFSKAKAVAKPLKQGEAGCSFQ